MPTSAGWVDQLAKGSLTVRELVRHVAQSPEHLQRFGNDARHQGVGTLPTYPRPSARRGRPAGIFRPRGRRGLGAVVVQIVNRLSTSSRSATGGRAWIGWRELLRHGRADNTEPHGCDDDQNGNATLSGRDLTRLFKTVHVRQNVAR